jgi:hypothetical protein
MRPHLVLTALAFAGLTACAAAAQQPSATAATQQPSTCPRCLNGYRFIPSSVVDDPFAVTEFQNGTGGGMALNLNIPRRNLDGEVVDTLTGNIGFFLLDFEYQYKVAKRLALRVNVNGIGRIGTSLEALVASGVSAAFGGSLGATVPIWWNQKFLISGVADVKTNKQYNVDPYGFVKGVVDSGYTSENKAALLSAENVARWSFGVRGAWGIAPWVGINADLEPGWADGSVSGNKSLNTFGAVAGFDFKKLNDVPIGATVGYRIRTGNGKTGNISGGYQSIELGMYYTGGKEYMIGGDFFLSRIAIQGGGVPDLNAVQFRLVTRIDF